VYRASAPLTEDRWAAGRVVNALLGAVLAGLAALLAARLWGRRVGLLALGLAALAAPLVVIGGSLLSDLLFATLLTGAVLAALEAGRRRPVALAALAGALLGLAVLTRPHGLAVLPLLLLAVRGAAAHGRGRAPAALLAATVLVVTPWTVRNTLQLGAVVPVSTHTGEALAGTYNPSTRARADHPGAWLPPMRVDELRDVYAATADEVERDRELRRRALRDALAHPAYVAATSARNTLRLLHLGGSEWRHGNAQAMSLPGWTGDLAALGFVPLAALALAGLAGRAARRAPAWLWCVPVVLLLTTVPVAGEMRMRAPVEPFVVLLAALGAEAAARAVSRRAGWRS
jgi:hypothetical protein